MDSKQVGEAIPLYQQIVAADPTDGEARENLARCYLSAGQRDKAVVTMEELIKLNPVQNHAYEFLAQIYEEDKNYDAAIAKYEMSLLVSPDKKQIPQAGTGGEAFDRGAPAVPRRAVVFVSAGHRVA